jgi:tripartite-type tricarboxylate transporter receptor subunit TctC
MRGLAVTTKTRWVNLPQVPTFSEQGFPDVTLETEHFLLAPAATPASILARYTKAALAVLSQDDIKSRVIQLGYAPVADGPDAVKERIVKNVPFFKQLIADAKIPQIE